MRQLKIGGENSKPSHLDGVPEEYLFVEALAKLFANTQEEMVVLYQIDVEKAKQLKDVLNGEQYEWFAAWVVRQTIYESKAENRGRSRAICTESAQG